MYKYGDYYDQYSEDNLRELLEELRGSSELDYFNAKNREDNWNNGFDALWEYWEK
jgi:hypothetical protein